MPMTVKVMVDGGATPMIDEIRAALSGLPNHIEWRLGHEKVPVGRLALVNRALRTPKNTFTALLSSEVRLEDKKWIGKIRQVFDRDPGAAMVDMHPNTIATTAAPVKRSRRLPIDDCKLVVVKTRFVTAKELVLDDRSPPKQWLEEALKTGHSVWHHPGVKFTVTEHEDHQLCASQSQTTRP